MAMVPWLVGYLLNNPDAKFSQIVKASQFERQEVYSWLFKSRHKSARDSRIRTMLEIEAFLDIHQRWQQVGYPFDHLVPSLATAIGSSGDRPAALAELVGTILNDGVRRPALRVDSLQFAVDTPYETRLVSDPDNGKRVMPVEVARALRGALSQVVDAGTAKRVAGSFTLADGTPFQVVLIDPEGTQLGSLEGEWTLGSDEVCASVPIDANAIFAAVMNGEERASTCVGEGLALPHARLEGLSRMRGVDSNTSRKVCKQTSECKAEIGEEAQASGQNNREARPGSRRPVFFEPHRHFYYFQSSATAALFLFLQISSFYPPPNTCFQDRRLRPLGHPS